MITQQQLPERDLPPGRHQELKGHLMREIRNGTRPRPARRYVLTAAVVAVVTTVTLVTLPGDGADADARPPSRQTVQTLERVALAAEHVKAPAGISDDEFVYVDSLVSYSQSQEGARTKIPPLHRAETWQSVDGARDGLIHEEGRGLRTLESDGKPGDRWYNTSTNYRHLSTLPTDPDRMFAWLRETAPQHTSQPTDQAMFELAGHLIQRSLVPPEVGAALFRAVARIPGVYVVDDAVDAAKRHGVGIGRKDPNNPARTEWIFDKRTHAFLGERTIATEGWSGTEPGEVTTSTAILNRAVVDKAGRRP